MIGIGRTLCNLLLLLHILGISNDFPSSVNISTHDFSRIYVTAGGVYKRYVTNKYSSICIPYSRFKDYQYLTVKSNEKYACRIHILKNKPDTHNEKVVYSDYFGKSFIIAKGIKLDIAIPVDARYIIILNSSEGHCNTPDSITLHTADALFAESIQANFPRDSIILSHKFLHWNLGNFSKGKYPYSTITEENYAVKLKGFDKIINNICSDSHCLFNEYNETFAKVNDNFINSISALFGKRMTYKFFPRSTSSGYNKLAAFWKEGLLCYRYGVFESLKGVKNSRGTFEYGAGYCISKYAIGRTTLYVMSLHAPNRIKSNEQDALYEEILSICSEYDNCILVGDFNRTATSSFRVLTNAGFLILNDKSVTHPPSGSILDWVLYRCKDVNLSDFKVLTEAVDDNGDILSDHLPLRFTVKVNR